MIFFTNEVAAGDDLAEQFKKMFCAMDQEDAELKSICISKILNQGQQSLELSECVRTGDFWGSEERFVQAIASYFKVLRCRECPIIGCSSNYEVHEGQRIRTCEQVVSPALGMDLVNLSQFARILNGGMSSPCVGTLDGDEAGTKGQKCKAKNVHITYKPLSCRMGPIAVYVLPLIVGGGGPKECNIEDQQHLLGRFCTPYFRTERKSNDKNNFCLTGTNYKTVAYTLFKSYHFVAVIRYGQKWFRYDELKSDRLVERTRP